MSTPAAAPFAEIADPAGDHELSIKVDVAVFDCAEGIARQRIVEGHHALAGGRYDGVGRLVVSPIVGQDESGAGETEDVYGEPVLEAVEPDPLALLRALRGARYRGRRGWGCGRSLGDRDGWEPLTSCHSPCIATDESLDGRTRRPPARPRVEGGASARGGNGAEVGAR